MGGWVGLLTWSMWWSSGERPPCMQKILPSTMAATGRVLKQSVKVYGREWVGGWLSNELLDR